MTGRNGGQGQGDARGRRDGRVDHGKSGWGSGYSSKPMTTQVGDARGRRDGRSGAGSKGRRSGYSFRYKKSRSLGCKEVGRAIKKSRLQGSWPSNQEVSAARKLAEQSRSLGGKEFGRATKESSDHEKSLRTMKRVFGPRKESHDQVKSLRTIKVESPSDYKS